MIYDEIVKEIRNAMIDRNSVKRDCLRSLVSDIKNLTVNAGKEITDDVCIRVVRKSVKQHEDSIDNFKIGKREDLAMKEMEELTYISGFLPKMLDENSTIDLVKKVMEDNNIEPNKKNMGLIMKSLPKRDDIDRKIISKFLQNFLK